MNEAETRAELIDPKELELVYRLRRVLSELDTVEGAIVCQVEDLHR